MQNKRFYHKFWGKKESENHREDPSGHFSNQPQGISSSHIKIGFIICSTGWGGLEINVLKLAEWLKERNWDITLYVIKDSKLYAATKDYSVNTFVINDHKKYFDFIEAYRFSKTLKQHGISILFVFDNQDMDLACLTKRMLFNRLKVIYQQHMQIGVNKKDFIHTLRFSGIDYWISPLEFLKKEVEKKTMFNPEKIKVIPLCTEIEKFITPKYTKQEARKKLNLHPSALFIGIIGRIDSQKGQLFTIKAIHELHKRGVDIKLVIVGEPTVNDPASKKYLSEMNNYVDKHNLSQEVYFRNFTNDVHVFYNAIDIFALASEGETYGMVTIEAMLSRLPIIATNSSGTPEILNYGELGLLYTPNDLEDFCQKIQWMLQQKDKSVEMAAKAQKTALSKYSHVQECEQIEDILRLCSDLPFEGVLDKEFRVEGVGAKAG